MPYPIGRYSDDTLALQRALELNGFDIGKHGPDGKMGPDTIKAIPLAREHFGLPRPSEPRIDLPLLLALGVRAAPTPPPPKPSPLKDWLIGLAIKQAVSHLKGLPQMAFLEGYKTYLVAGVLIAIGALGLVGVPIPGFEGDPGYAFATAIGLITGRAGAKSDVNKALGK